LNASVMRAAAVALVVKAGPFVSKRPVSEPAMRSSSKRKSSASIVSKATTPPIAPDP
jgi:hypothetical protein